MSNIAEIDLLPIGVLGGESRLVQLSVFGEPDSAAHGRSRGLRKEY